MANIPEKSKDPLWLQSDKTHAQHFHIVTMMLNTRREMDEGPLEYFMEQRGEAMWSLQSRPRSRAPSP